MLKSTGQKLLEALNFNRWAWKNPDQIFFSFILKIFQSCVYIKDFKKFMILGLLLLCHWQSSLRTFWEVIYSCNEVEWSEKRRVPHVKYWQILTFKVWSKLCQWQLRNSGYGQMLESLLDTPRFFFGVQSQNYNFWPE